MTTEASLRLRDVVTSIPQLDNSMTARAALPSLFLSEFEHRCVACCCTIAVVSSLLALRTGGDRARFAEA